MGIYYLDEKKVDFDESITLWTMFYLRKSLDEPHGGKQVREAINAFLGRSLLRFRRIE